MEAQVGDRIVVEANKVGGARKQGEVREVIEGVSGKHYRVGWEDGHESIVFPSSDATVVAGTRRA
jgi:Domain of unknown function (DUF1918)